MTPPSEQPNETRTERPHSLELHRDAKGAYSWTAKVYFGPTEEDFAIEQVESVDATLRRIYLHEGEA